MHRAGKFALGCLLAPIGLGVLALVLFGLFRAAGVPEAHMGNERLEQSLPRAEHQGEASALQTRSNDSGRPRTDLEKALPLDVSAPVRVVLRLEEGSFEIRGDETVDGIEVDADYDQATYELTQDWSVVDGLPTYSLRFRSKISWLRRMARKGGFTDDDLTKNRLEIRLPQGTPMQLELDITRSETEVDLSGLALTGLVTKTRMGEYLIETRELNPVILQSWVADVGMGEVELRGIARLRARRIDLTGGMGEVRVDFGESLHEDADVRVRMRMGEMRVMVPDDVLWDAGSRAKASLGEVHDLTRRDSAVIDPETAHRLHLDARITMGELTLEEFRAGEEIR